MTMTSSGVSTTDEQLVAGCLLGSFDGTVVPAWLLDRVRDGLGGVLLFAQNVVDDAQVAEACAVLRSARADVLIAIDEEGGDVTRLDAERGSDVPTPFAFGVVDDVGLTRDAFGVLGERVHALGIDLVLAPCADINSNPLNPIIGLRSFGTSAERVARHVVAAVEGFRAGGLAVCAKHYPGHGDTNADTHIGPARIDASFAVLNERELVPFAAAIAAGVDAVLTAHIVVPALDDAPVSLSAHWTRHLRDVSGFTGSIITDALDMDAVAAGRGIDGVADAAVLAFEAGADLLCLGSNFDASMTDAVIDAMSAAVAAGRIERHALVRSGERNAALRRTRSSARPPTTRDASAIVAERALVVAEPVPTGPCVVLECRPRGGSACFNVHWGIVGDLGALGWRTASIVETDPVAEVCAALLDGATEPAVVVVVRDIDVHAWQRDVAEHVVRIARRPVVVVEMGWPSTTPVDGALAVVTHGAAGVSARALVARLTGVPRDLDDQAEES
jgi:beta-N-acetylhexosaminidase